MISIGFQEKGRCLSLCVLLFVIVFLGMFIIYSAWCFWLRSCETLDNFQIILSQSAQMLQAVTGTPKSQAPAPGCIPDYLWGGVDRDKHLPPLRFLSSWFSATRPQRGLDACKVICSFPNQNGQVTKQFTTESTDWWKILSSVIFTQIL